MGQFRNSSLILMSLLLCSCFTEGAIDSWQVNTETAISATDTPIGVTVAETSVVTTVLFTLTATVSTGALVSYAIETQPTSGQFKIGAVGHADAGKVQLETGQVLDYETGASIKIEVIAVDDTTGTPLTGTATVTITITDVTTYTPVFTTPSTFITCVATPDTSAANTALYTVVAANAVTNSITYSIATGNTDTDFAISAGGAITVANALDKTRTALYGLVVFGTDAVTDTATETGIVLIAVTVGGTCPSTTTTTTTPCSGAGTVAASVITIMSGILLSLFKLV